MTFDFLREPGPAHSDEWGRWQAWEDAILDEAFAAKGVRRMTIEFLASYLAPEGKRYNANEIADLPDGVARHLVATGIAQEYKARENKPGAAALDDPEAEEPESDGGEE